MGYGPLGCKDPGDGHIGRNNIEHQIRGAGRASRRTGKPGKSARHQEDEQHDHDIIIPDALCADMDLLVWWYDEYSDFLLEAEF